MDPTVKQILDGFRFSIDNYASTLDPANKKLSRSRELLEHLLRLLQAVDTLLVALVVPGKSVLDSTSVLAYLLKKP